MLCAPKHSFDVVFRLAKSPELGMKKNRKIEGFCAGWHYTF